MSQLHGAAGSVLLGASVALALTALGAAVAGGAPPWLDRLRVALAVGIVAQAAIGLALALRGAGPAEAIHWVYGAVLIAVPVAIGALAASVPARVRTGALAGGATVMAFLAWRLAATG
jgi:hypothetical protein